MNQPTNRLLLRGALRIHEAMVRAGHEVVPNLPLTAWQELHDIHKRLERAVKRSWIHAAAHARAEIDHSFSYLVRQLEECRRSLAAQKEPARVCSPRDIHRELVALQTELMT